MFYHLQAEDDEEIIVDGPGLNGQSQVVSEQAVNCGATRNPSALHQDTFPAHNSVLSRQTEALSKDICILSKFN